MSDKQMPENPTLIRRAEFWATEAHDPAWACDLTDLMPDVIAELKRLGALEFAWQQLFGDDTPGEIKAWLDDRLSNGQDTGERADPEALKAAVRSAFSTDTAALLAPLNRPTSSRVDSPESGS